MISSPKQRNGQARWRLTIVVFISGALIAAVGYGWVDVVSASPNYDPTGPGLCVYAIGAALLTFAQVSARIRVRPRHGWHVLWVSCGLAGLAATLNVVGLSINDPTDVASFELFILSMMVGVVAIVVALIALLIVAMVKL